MNSTFQTLNKTFFNTASGKSSVRECDKILCLRAYKYLKGLTYLIEPSDDLRAVLTIDVFVKSNPKAFFLVMHYLFMALDPVEFKQRFYWPLDKNTENTFRTKTVQYLNDLNKKYELGLGTVPTFIVVVPGGTKFLSVLLKLLRLVMRDLIKKKQKVGNINDIILHEKFEPFTMKYMADIIYKSKMWHENCAKMVKKCTENILILDNHSISLKKILHALINLPTACINSNLYSIKINERDITQILNHHFVAMENHTAQYEQFTNILYKFITTAHQKINTNSTSLVQLDSTQLQKSTVVFVKYNNELTLDSSTDKIIKSKLSNLYVLNKSTINLIDLYDILLFYSGQIKSRFFNHSSVNVKNLQINANVLDEYLIRLIKNSKQLMNLKCSINNYKEVIGHGLLHNTKLEIDSNRTITAAALKVSIMMTPRLKWANLNDMVISQTLTMTQQPDNINGSSHNNTTLLSALLSSRKENRSASKRTRFIDLTENLNLDSSFELQLQQSTITKVSNTFNKTLKNIKINLNTDKFESPPRLGGDAVFLTQDRTYKSILKNRNTNLGSEKCSSVNVSPTGKYEFTKIKSDGWDVDETMLFKGSLYSNIENSIKGRSGSSSSLIDYTGCTSGNISNGMQNTQITLGDDDSGFQLLGTNNNMESPLKRIDKPTKFPYRIIDTIDLTASIEKINPIPPDTTLDELRENDENNFNQINISGFSENNINLLDTSDSCLNDVTLLK